MIDLTSIKVELADVKPYECECCGRYSKTVHGYLWDRTGETAVYFAGYTEGHSPRSMNFLVSVGGWDEETFENRHAIPMRVVQESTSDAPLVELVEPETSPWHGWDRLGHMESLERLTSEANSLAIELAKKVLVLDPRIVAYLSCGELVRPSQN